MAIELKKISELLVTSQIDGTEYVPLLKRGGNPRTTLADLKEYFRDSTLAIFEEVDNSDTFVLLLPFEREEGATFDIVYKAKDKAFVERKTTASGVGYTHAYTRSTDYMDGLNVRTDRVFFNAADKELYVFNGDLRNIFDTVRINAMTEDEFNKLENPIEGAFYATYE